MFDNNLRELVEGIIENVRINGDKALSLYSGKFDGQKLLPADFKVSAREIDSSVKNVKPEVRTALRNAASNIYFFHKNEAKRLIKRWTVTRRGISAGQCYNPVESAGIYVSGGVHAYYPSIVLMCAIPARTAGVKKIIMTTPPKNIVPEVLYAAKIAGITEIYRIGGAHAIAALAFGTPTIPKVDFIAGPGSKYVTEAKRQVFGSAGIDLLAGPSEIAVICDSTADAEIVAADLLAQAEHSPDSKSYVFSDSIPAAAEIRNLLRRKNKNYTAQISVKVSDINYIIRAVNRLAPEHLEVMHRKANSIAREIKNAGAIFMGKYSPVALGDYYSGPSHVLPTAGTARFSSGLSVMTFLKRTSIIRTGYAALKKASADIISIAKSEKLVLHAESIKIRVKRGAL